MPDEYLNEPICRSAPPDRTICAIDSCSTAQPKFTGIAVVATQHAHDSHSSLSEAILNEHCRRQASWASEDIRQAHAGGFDGLAWHSQAALTVISTSDSWRIYHDTSLAVPGPSRSRPRQQPSGAFGTSGQNIRASRWRGAVFESPASLGVIPAIMDAYAASAQLQQPCRTSRQCRCARNICCAIAMTADASNIVLYRPALRLCGAVQVFSKHLACGR